MKKMTKAERAEYRARIADADVVIALTVVDARTLPGMLGRVVPAFLQVKGFYAALVDGKRTLYTDVHVEGENR